jgi:hypothetical protein
MTAFLHDFYTRTIMISGFLAGLAWVIIWWRDKEKF